MAVHVKGNLYARMPELLLNVLYVLAGGDSDAGIRMPQRMERDMPQARPFQRRVKISLDHVVVADRVSVSRAENKIMLVLR